jgi:hypothetical protein
MRTLLATVMFVGVGLAGISASHAMPAASAFLPQSSAITQVEGGCGPGGFRDRYGVCRPRGWHPAPYRRCPPRMHMTPHGCRWN